MTEISKGERQWVARSGQTDLQERCCEGPSEVAESWSKCLWDLARLTPLRRAACEGVFLGTC